MKRLATLVLILLMTFTASAATTTVILVRHAEKAAPEGDPPLSEAGAMRANELARVLAGTKIDAIYVTQYLRTQQTAQPIAEARKLEPKMIKAGNKEYASTVAKEIREQHAGQTVLIVGHLNTTVDLLRELGIKDPAPIPETQYDDLFIVTITDGQPALVPLRYGTIAR